MKPLPLHLRLCWLAWVGGVLGLLQGCVTPTMRPPAVDQARFTPMPVQKRVIEEPRVKFLPREDGFEYCARVTGIPITPTYGPWPALSGT